MNEDAILNIWKENEQIQVNPSHLAFVLGVLKKHNCSPLGFLVYGTPSDNWIIQKMY